MGGWFCPKLGYNIDATILDSPSNKNLLFQLTMTTYVYLIPTICPTQWLHRIFGCVWGFVCPSRANGWGSWLLFSHPFPSPPRCLLLLNNKKSAGLRSLASVNFSCLILKKSHKNISFGNKCLHFCYEVEIPLIIYNWDLQTRKSSDLRLQFEVHPRIDQRWFN